MTSESLTEKASSFYGQHKQAASNLGFATSHYIEAGRRLTETSRALAEARFRHDESTTSYLRGGGSWNRTSSLSAARYEALDRNTAAETHYYEARGDEQIAKRAYDENIGSAGRDYEANADAYHQMAIEDAQRAGVEVNFSGAVATNVRIVK